MVVSAIAGLGAAAITVFYIVIMVRQRDSGDAVSVVLITVTFVSSAVTLIDMLSQAMRKRLL